MSKILLDGVSLALGREYTASSAYLLQFEGSISSDLATIIWEGWALGKCRFFIWTAAMNKVLTADALLLRGWENKYFCPLCMRKREPLPSSSRVRLVQTVVGDTGRAVSATLPQPELMGRAHRSRIGYTFASLSRRLTTEMVHIPCGCLLVGSFGESLIIF
jgi:hypothetical protein